MIRTDHVDVTDGEFDNFQSIRDYLPLRRVRIEPYLVHRYAMMPLRFSVSDVVNADFILGKSFRRVSSLKEVNVCARVYH